MLLAALRQHKLKVLQLTGHLNPENKKVPVGLSMQLLADWQDWVESQTRSREADISWGSADDWWGAGGDPWFQARSGQQGQSGGGYGWDSYMSTTVAPATTQPQHYHSNSCNRTASGFGKVCNWDELSVMVVAGLAMVLASFRWLALLKRLALLG